MRSIVVDVAYQWVGTRWLHQAYAKGFATDCIGLIGGVALELGIEGAQAWADDPTLHCYGRTPDPKLLLGGCDRFLTRIPVKDAGLGDILVMSFERDPQHFAIISRVNPMYIIHAYAQRRQVVENGVDVAGAKILRAYRYRGVA